MDARRDLAFERPDEVMPEVERLLRGHEIAGSWTLGQIIHHLALTIRLSLRGNQGPTGQPPEPDQARVFKVRRRLFFREGRFPEGVEVPFKALLPAPGVRLAYLGRSRGHGHHTCRRTIRRGGAGAGPLTASTCRPSGITPRTLSGRASDPTGPRPAGPDTDPSLQGKSREEDLRCGG